jgi:hypothetical protein
MKGQKTGGRTRGTRNKVTAEVKDLARRYSDEAIRTLADIMLDGEVILDRFGIESPRTPAAARVAAAKELLDRAYGKAPQAITGEDGGAVKVDQEITIRFVHANAPRDPGGV